MVKNLLYEFQPNSKKIIIAFTGFGNGLMVHPFDFFKFTQTLNYSRILVKDPSHRLYLKGINKNCNSVLKLKEKLEKIIKLSKAKEIIITGTSAGGFAALLFGHLLKANIVHAFSPYTYLDFKNVFLHLDISGIKNSWRTLLKLHFQCIKYYNFFDLRKILSQWNGITNYNIYVCEKNRWDFMRANHLKDTSHLKIHPFPCNSHNIIRYLYKKKLLWKIFKDH